MRQEVLAVLLLQPARVDEVHCVIIVSEELSGELVNLYAEEFQTVEVHLIAKVLRVFLNSVGGAHHTQFERLFVFIRDE